MKYLNVPSTDAIIRLTFPQGREKSFCLWNLEEEDNFAWELSLSLDCSRIDGGVTFSRYILFSRFLVFLSLAARICHGIIFYFTMRTNETADKENEKFLYFELSRLFERISSVLRMQWQIFITTEVFQNLSSEVSKLKQSWIIVAG